MTIWALLFGTEYIFYSGCVLLVLLVILNIVFQIFFSYTFNRNVTPEDKRKKFKAG